MDKATMEHGARGRSGQRIRPLPDLLVNQIAAGEVIERPASVVKELLENSLDAGASRIEIRIEGGGIDRIVVSDDGSGIAAADLPGALRRHWTSKLDGSSDLVRIPTLGFRGEALASIAAVADVSLTTYSTADSHAWQLDVAAGGEVQPPRPAQGRRGTRVSVGGLFSKVPARRRFLKQPRTEYLHVQRLVRQYAFARPDVRFDFEAGEARGLHLGAAGDELAAPRWRQLFGRAFVEQARPLVADAGGVSVRGWVGTAALASSQSDLQFLCVNGRMVRDRQLAHAVRVAYAETLPEGRFPRYAVRLQITPEAVDVNVHPGKLEVRFAALRDVHDLLLGAVRRALGDDPLPLVPPTAPAAARSGGIEDARNSSYRVPGPPPRQAPGVTSPRHVADRTMARPLALVARRYALLARNGRVARLDVRTAWQQVLERRLTSGDAAPRRLLLPHRISARRFSACPVWAELGFVFERLSESGEVLRALPKVLPELDHASLCAALPDRIEDAATAVAVVAAAAADAVLAGREVFSASDFETLQQAAGAAGVDLGPAMALLDAEDMETLLGRRR